MHYELDIFIIKVVYFFCYFFTHLSFFKIGFLEPHLTEGKQALEQSIKVRNLSPQYDTQYKMTLYQHDWKYNITTSSVYSRIDTDQFRG